jgi:hypothetical protein
MTKQEKLEHVLADGNWHSTEELVQNVGHRFSATIHIAIHQHHFQIEKRRSTGNQFEYRKLLREDVRSSVS